MLPIKTPQEGFRINHQDVSSLMHLHIDADDERLRDQL